ncbi:hypothetical protein GOBAR_DD19697 [Gossypium barbadense]|nr:hypothetical protein GOBAR_DD19697 [Gossypium barbadense]
MAEQSKVLNTSGAEKQTKRELFDALRQELETPVLERASKAVWELILDSNGLGKEISETVERVFCKLSGREPPLFPYSNDIIALKRDHLHLEAVEFIAANFQNRYGGRYWQLVIVKEVWNLGRMN